MRTYKLGDQLPDLPLDPPEEPDYSNELDNLEAEWIAQHSVVLRQDKKGSWGWEILDDHSRVHDGLDDGGSFHICADDALVQFQRYAKQSAEEMLAYKLDPANRDDEKLP